MIPSRIFPGFFTSYFDMYWGAECAIFCLKINFGADFLACNQLTRVYFSGLNKFLSQVFIEH